MKTDQLIALLAQGAGPAPQRPVLRRLAPVAALGALASGLIAVAWLGCVPANMFLTAAPWIKLAYAAALAASAGWLTARLARPVARLAAPLRAVVAVAVVMGLLGALAWAATPTPLRPAALMGHSWQACPLYVSALAAPVLAGLLWALRGLAPTRPAAAGAAAGLLAGALGAAGYALVCTEESTAFIALWYSAGIALTGMVGAVLGPRVLRW
jgi:hypothetical protein